MEKLLVEVYKRYLDAQSRAEDTLWQSLLAKKVSWNAVRAADREAYAARRAFVLACRKAMISSRAVKRAYYALPLGERCAR